MGYAVELFLKDDDQCQAIRQLFATTGSILAQIGACPHISLAVFEDVDTAKLIGIVKSFAAQTPRMTVRFSSVGLFPGLQNVVFLAPVVTSRLLSAHEALQRQLAEDNLLCEPCYCPGSWVPHCTITVEEPFEDSLNTIRQAYDREVLGEYEIDRVAVVEFRPVVNLAAFRLGATPTR